MVPLFNKKVNYKEHPKVGIYGFHIFDEGLVKFFEKLGIPPGSKYKIEIPIKIRKNQKIQHQFLRGLFDTDGCIYFDRNRSAKHPINNVPTIQLALISEKLIKQVYEILINFGLHPRLKKPYQGKGDRRKVHTILIYRREDIRYFIEKIGFKNPKHHTKWLVFKKLGYCPPKTTLVERKNILRGKKAYKPLK
jgi:intein/homing endonuclease